MQPGVRFAHGVQFWMPKRTLLSRTHTQNNSWRFKTCKNMHGRMCKQKHIKGKSRSGMTEKEGRRAFGDGGRKMTACLTKFTDVPFSPAGGCLLLLFLIQHQSGGGQHKPVDREKKYTRLELRDTIRIQLWVRHKSPWMIAEVCSKTEGLCFFNQS